MTEDQKTALCKTFKFIPLICNVNKLNDIIFAGLLSLKYLNLKSSQPEGTYHRFFFLYRDASDFQLCSLTKLQTPLSYCYKTPFNRPSLLDICFEQELSQSEQKDNIDSDNLHLYSWILKQSTYHANQSNEFQTLTFYKSESNNSLGDQREKKMTQKEIYFLTSNCCLYGEYVLRRLLSM